MESQNQNQPNQSQPKLVRKVSFGIERLADDQLGVLLALDVGEDEPVVFTFGRVTFERMVNDAFSVNQTLIGMYRNR